MKQSVGLDGMASLFQSSLNAALVKRKVSLMGSIRHAGIPRRSTNRGSLKLAQEILFFKKIS